MLCNAEGPGGGGGSCQISQKKKTLQMYVQLNVFSVMRGVGGCQVSREKKLRNN